jgi:hypothetical protein
VRILVTGTTKQQIGGGTQLGYEPVADLFVKGLRFNPEWQVEHRLAEIGEVITDYDAVFVGLVPPLSIASHYLYAALNTIHQCETQGIPLILYVDDWAFPSMIGKLKTAVKNPEHLTKPFFERRYGHEWAVVHRDLLVGVLERLLEQTWPPTVIPAFTWGDHQVLQDRLPMVQRAVFVDPSLFARGYAVHPVPPEDKQRQWVLGTVSDQRTWLGKQQLGWDVRYIGSRSSKATEKMQEQDLVALYAKSWGVLSPPYKQILGTGWWRNRFVYTSWMRSILFCDPGEAPQLGGAFQLNPLEVSEMSVRDLANVADWQWREQAQRMMSRDRVHQTLRDAITASMERVA